MENSKKSAATIYFEQLFKQFNDLVKNSGKPELTLSIKDFVEYYDFCFVDGVEAAVRHYLWECNKGAK